MQNIYIYIYAISCVQLTFCRMKISTDLEMHFVKFVVLLDIRFPLFMVLEVAVELLITDRRLCVSGSTHRGSTDLHSCKETGNTVKLCDLTFSFRLFGQSDIAPVLVNSLPR